MKRLVIINILLMIALNILPNEVKVEAKSELVSIQVSEQVSSRSLEEPRQENSTELDKIESKPTNISQDAIEFIKSFERVFDHSQET